MISFFYRHRAFFLPFGLLWLGVGYIQFFYSQNYIIVSINRLWTPAQDWIFSFMTFLGDGIFVIGMVLLFAWFSIKKGTLILAGYVFSGIIVQLSKHFVFPDAHRPARVMENILPWLHTVSGVAMYQNGSFPSGHTTSAFALFAMLAFFNSSMPYKLFFLLLALLVAYSRMYLLQHYLLDVHMGAFLGTGTAALLYYLSEKKVLPRLDTWENRGLRELLSKKES
ncbi:phosphatase PAP2 family protein [Arundinibacter roseus]|nr:phosphatase PAP2 family protein [Arundinibacter roseus]